MKYLVKQNKITINDLTSFNIVHILECGQIFRFENKGDFYEVVSGSELAKVYTYENKVEIECTNTDYFINFFDLETNYEDIKKQLITFEVMKKPMHFGCGIRILKQPQLEMFISFIISANNNIKRIQGSIKKLCEQFGSKINSELGNYYAFPTLNQLKKVTEQNWKNFGVGYRANYLVESVLALENYDLTKLENLDVTTATKELEKFKGIGTKVANCILLFGYYNMFTFPVDTWIEKVYNDFFAKEKHLKNREQIRKNLVKKFGKLSGYAQQYLFYYKRENK